MFLWETAIIVCISLALIAFIILNFNEKIEELIQTPVGELFSLQNIWAPALVVLFLFFIGGIMPGRFFSSIPVTQVFRQYTENKKRWKYPLLFCAICRYGILSRDDVCSLFSIPLYDVKRFRLQYGTVGVCL